jgi:hypothetical protein
LGKATFAGTGGKKEDAPIPAVGDRVGTARFHPTQPLLPVTGATTSRQKQAFTAQFSGPTFVIHAAIATFQWTPLL